MEDQLCVNGLTWIIITNKLLGLENLVFLHVCVFNIWAIIFCSTNVQFALSVNPSLKLTQCSLHELPYGRGGLFSNVTQYDKMSWKSAEPLLSLKALKRFFANANSPISISITIADGVIRKSYFPFF